MSLRDNHAKILCLRDLKLTFLRFEVELVLAEVLQDDAHNMTMLLESLGVDEDVIEVYANDSLCNQIVEDVIHHCLECGRAVSQTKEHYQGFKESAIGPKHCLPLISFLDVHVVVASTDIQLGEIACAPKVVDEFRDEW